jgi:hypothetical protein
MMVDDREVCPLHFDDHDDYGRLREVLRQANYTDRGVVEALGIEDVHSLSGREVSLLLHRTRRMAPLDTLIRLFLIGVPVDPEWARRAVAPMKLDQWTRAGLVRMQEASVVAEVQMLPFQDLVLAFDQPRRIQRSRAANYVMGVGSSSLTLASLTVRRTSRLTLDLGTGCGFQAFQAARHSDQVLATDRNPRAVSLAAFNARLNDLANVDCLQGDLFEPVQGRRFDLIVSNPPFVISPETHYIYRDSGMHGDEVSRAIVRQAPQFLREGGYCQILCNWAHVAGQDWQQRLATWFEGTGCDAWVMRSHTLESGDYAAKWIEHTERDDPGQFSRRFDQWMEHYGQHRIEAVSAGLVTLRRRSGASNWFRADDGAEKILGTAGEAIARGFELRDFLEAAQGDEWLMSQRLRVSPDVRLQQEFEPCSEGWRATQSELRLVRGLAYSGNVDPFVAQLISRCNGEHRLAELVNELASSLDEEPDRVGPVCRDVVRRLIERGFLLPEEATT